MSLTPGERLGAYEIVAQIGAGGMGEVYRARDSKLKREVAIKVLPADVANDRERLARFQREAEVLASLNHPHIAHVYGIEDPSPQSGHAALVMELVEGEDLSQRLARGALPVDEALTLARQVAEALEAAHDAGVIHRDLKPANIKVRDDGTVKVLDFGLAKSHGSAGGGTAPASLANSPTITSPAMTQQGVILGTAAYMSPEQAKGRVVDRRSDVWAFGCVLYEMLTGARAFTGDDVTDIITSVMRDAPNFSALPASTPASIRTLLRRCLEKDPRKRAPHIAIARLAIDDWMTATGELVQPHAPPPPAAPLRRPVAAAVALASVVVALMIGWASSRYFAPLPPAPPVVRFDLVATGGSILQANFNRRLLAVSPDGRQIAFTADALYVRPIGDSNAIAVPGTDAFGSITHPVFSPDGTSIAFWAASDRSLKRVVLGANTITTICRIGEGGYGIDWAADGNVYFGDNAKGILRVSANGGTPEVVIPTSGRDEAYGPQLLPDGDTVLYTLGTRNMASWDNARIAVRSLKTGAQKFVIDNATDAHYVNTGHVIFNRGGIAFAIAFDARNLATVGAPVAMVEGVRRAAPGTTGAVQLAVSDGGTLAYIEGSTALGGLPLQIAMFDRAGAAEPLNIPLGAYAHPRVSPDGSQVSMTVDDGKDVQVWVYGIAKASAMRRLTFGGNNRLAEWSQDGVHLAFQSTREGDAAVWWQRADGTDTATRITRPSPGAAHVPQSFSPDGHHLLFDEVTDAKVTLWDWSFAAGKATPIAIPDDDVPTDATFSPDGRWFAYTTRFQASQSVVYVEPYPPTGARYQISTTPEDGHHPLWRRDGKEIFYTPGPGNRFHAKAITTAPAFGFGDAVLIPRPFVNAPPSSERTYDIMPDGRIMALRMDIGPDGKPIATRVQVVLNWFDELKQRVPTK